MWGANTDHKFLRLPNEDIFRYNATDAWATAHLHLALQRELADPKVGNWGFYQQWVRPLMQSVLAMQRRGILVDRTARDALKSQLKAELDEVDSAIRAHADRVGFKYTDKFPNSGAQVAKFLFGACELKPAGKTEKGAPKTDQGAIVRVLRDLRKKDESHRGVLLNLNHRSRIQTIWERYLTFQLPPDSRCRARVKMCGTKTFRYSMAEPALHQFPMEVRGFFVPKPGHVFLNIDKSALEAMILAVLSGDEISLEVFRNHGDIHVQNARDAWGFTNSGWSGLSGSQQKAYRYESKTRLYRISYGGRGAVDKEKIRCQCPRPECTASSPPVLGRSKADILGAEERWFRVHSSVARWQDHLLREVRRDHFYQSPFGVRRWISAPWSNETAREVMNIPMQMNAALMMIQHQVELGDAPILLQHHDAFLFEVPETEAEQRAADYKGLMERKIPELGGWVFPCKVSIGMNWADKSPANPNGLAEI